MTEKVPRTADGRALTQQEQLLLLIEQTCTRFEGAAWLPPSRGRAQLTIGRDIYYVLVSGGGDAAILRAFERKGWIEWEPRLGKYACRITAAGKLRAQKIEPVVQHNTEGSTE